MAHKVRQDIAGYNIAIQSIGVEYTRALENTTRSPEEYQGALDRIQWLLDLYRREQRELLTNARSEGFRAPSRKRSPPAKRSPSAPAVPVYGLSEAKVRR